MTETIHGHFVVRDYNDTEVHRVPCRYAKHSPNWEKAEMGIFRQMDTEKYVLFWEENE